MEFLSCLQRALDCGVTREQFLRVWEAERKLLQLQAETRRLELDQLPITRAREQPEVYAFPWQQFEELVAKTNKLRQEMKKIGRVEEEVKNLRRDFQNWKNEVKEELINSSCLRIGELLDPVKVQIKDLHTQNTSLMKETRKLNESTLQEIRTHTENVRRYIHELGVTGGHCTDQGEAGQEVTTQSLDTSREVSDLADTRQEVSDPADTSREVSDQSGLYTDELTDEENVTQSPSYPEEFYPSENADQLLWQSPDLQENQSSLVPYCTQDLPNVSPHIYGWSGTGPNHVDSIFYIPSDGLDVIIPDCDQLTKHRHDFYTEFFYTRGKLCKARFRIWFNKRGRMGVSALLSQGIMDDQHQWPLSVAGWGQIYNPTSRKFSKIWEVEAQECQRPQPGIETPLGAAVQLCTSRSTCDDVTQAVLMKRRYLDDAKTLTFRCFLWAEEVKVQLDPLQLAM
ncbi:uncharacterized protein LOC131938562 [Physella acuta]|uniref:uncharacterized protein LOC131938562 n=1 Tax=Physella acuta TaxID=109671 RepID=UPI0027DD39EA|nr:uncharacterized protein LOC131938562 [Physella acuta]